MILISDIRLLSTRLCSLTFGLGGTDENGNTKEGFGYYETIAGGSGAGPSWHGTSGESL